MNDKRTMKTSRDKIRASSVGLICLWVVALMFYFSTSEFGPRVKGQTLGLLTIIPLILLYAHWIELSDLLRAAFKRVRRR
jgi:hypothetical protein